MLAACLATLLWSMCVVASRRSLEQLGEIPANFWRMVLAVLCLGLVSHLSKVDFHSGAFFYLFLSGMVGFGIGDLGLYYALSRIGSRLTILMAQCAAVPVAFTVEWLWLGNLISLKEAGAICIVLGGIILALLPGPGQLQAGDRRQFILGIISGLIAAIGQGVGGVLSRIAYKTQGTLSDQIGTIDGIQAGAYAGYQRLLGGLAVITFAYFLGRIFRSPKSVNRVRAHDPVVSKCLWVVLAALTGPVVGIACFQWALITTEAAIAQTIVALTPIVIIPFAYWIEGERPSPRSLLGGVVAVAGVILLALI